MPGGEHERQRPQLGPKARSTAELRRERQAKALRENLKRRKQRERDAGDASDGARGKSDG